MLNISKADSSLTHDSFVEYFTQEDARCAARVLDGECLGGQRVHVVDHQVRCVIPMYRSEYVH